MQPEFESNRVVFCASTGRTATMFLAACLNRLEGVVGLHEEHVPGNPPLRRLPLINVHNRRAWHDPEYTARLVSETRSAATLDAAAEGARLLVDVAYYNAPLLAALTEHHPGASLFVIFRRCEGFVRSATITSGEDAQPAGWPCRSKPLTKREQFISLGRLRPERDHRDRAPWPDWSGVQRNIWLWTTVNRHLLAFADTHPKCHRLFFEDLVEHPTAFWTDFQQAPGALSSSALSEYVTFSTTRINQRPRYQWAQSHTGVRKRRPCTQNARAHWRTRSMADALEARASQSSSRRCASKAATRRLRLAPKTRWRPSPNGTP